MASPGSMKIRFSPDFYRQYKKMNVRVQNRVDECIRIFKKDPMDPQLNNHLLREQYQNYRSIDITSDYRAHYEEIIFENDNSAYFIALGTHEQLYGANKKEEN